MAGNQTSIIDIGAGLAPNLLSTGQNVFNIVTWGIIIIFIAGAIAIGAFLIIQRKRYKYTLIIFEDINGSLVDVVKDKGMEIKFGNLGTTVMYFKKLKRYEPFPKIQSGNRKFYFEKKPNGILMNTLIRRNMDGKELEMQEMSQAMLYHHTAINRGMEKRYDQLSKFQQYAPIIVSVAFIIVIGVMTWLLFDKWISLANATNAGLDTGQKVMASSNAILGKLDNILIRTCGGSGYITNSTT